MTDCNIVDQLLVGDRFWLLKYANVAIETGKKFVFVKVYFAESIENKSHLLFFVMPQKTVQQHEQKAGFFMGTILKLGQHSHDWDQNVGGVALNTVVDVFVGGEQKVEYSILAMRFQLRILEVKVVVRVEYVD